MRMSFVLDLVGLRYFQDVLDDIDANSQVGRWILYHTFLEFCKLPPSGWAGFFTGLHSNYIFLLIFFRLVAELYITLTVGSSRRNSIIPSFDLVLFWLLCKGLSPLPDGAFYYGLEGPYYLSDAGDRINPFSSLSKPQLLEHLAFYSYLVFPFSPSVWVILGDIPPLLWAGARTLCRFIIVPIQPILVTPLFYIAEWLFTLCYDDDTHMHIYLSSHNICVNPRQNDRCALKELEVALSLVTDQARQKKTLQATLAKKDAEKLVLQRQLAEKHAAITEKDAIIRSRDATIEKMNIGSRADKAMLARSQERIEDLAVQIRSLEAENARLQNDAVIADPKKKVDTCSEALEHEMVEKNKRIRALKLENAIKDAQIVNLVSERADKDARQTRELKTASQECARLMHEFAEYKKNVALEETRRCEEMAALALEIVGLLRELSDMDTYSRRLEDENTHLKQETQGSGGRTALETPLTQRMEKLERCLTTQEEQHRQELAKKDAIIQILEDDKAATQVRYGELQVRTDNARAEAGVLATTVRDLPSAPTSTHSAPSVSSKVLEIDRSQLADALGRIKAIEPVERELDSLQELVSVKRDLQCLDREGDSTECFLAHQREHDALSERLDVDLTMADDSSSTGWIMS